MILQKKIYYMRLTNFPKSIESKQKMLTKSLMRILLEILMDSKKVPRFKQVRTIKKDWAIVLTAWVTQALGLLKKVFSWLHTPPFSNFIRYKKRPIICQFNSYTSDNQCLKNPISSFFTNQFLINDLNFKLHKSQIKKNLKST